MSIQSFVQDLTIVISFVLSFGFLISLISIRQKRSISSELRLGPLSWALKIDNEEQKSLPEE
jgi:hypothetical protein